MMLVQKLQGSEIQRELLLHSYKIGNKELSVQNTLSCCTTQLDIPAVQWDKKLSKCLANTVLL